jgi:putative hemolysin
VLTVEDILDTIFAYQPSRSKLVLDRKPIHDLAPGKWLVAGITSLRRLERYLKMELPPSKSVTVAGVVQEEMQRLAAAGDRCRWGRFELHVLEAPQRGHILIELTLLEREDAQA